MATTTVRRKAPVPKVGVVRRGSRDPLDVPARYRKPGMRYRWVARGDSPADTEARIDEMTELGYKPVIKEGTGDEAVSHRNLMLFVISEKQYERRQLDKVRENERANRAQQRELQQNFRRKIGGEGRVLGSGVETGVPEPLLTREERFQETAEEA